jgi:hypothetical protein
MKKTILLIVTLIALAIAAYSQKSVVARYSKYGERNEQDSFIFKKDYTYSGITFTMQDSTITANDEAHSVYKIKGGEEIQNEGDKKFKEYICIDEQGKDCHFTILMYDNGEKYIILAYVDWAIIYKI